MGQAEKTRVIITVIGQDKPGIIAGISGLLAAADCNILDISQTSAWPSSSAWRLSTCGCLMCTRARLRPSRS